MPSKSKKQGSGPANVSKTFPTTNPSQNPPNTTDATKSADRPVRSADTRSKAQQTNTSDTTEEELWPATGQDAANKSVGDISNAPAVNRKKQKRRAKEAAKRAEQQQLEANESVNQMSTPNGPNGHVSYPHSSRGPQKGYFTEEPEYIDPDFVDDTVDMETFYSGGEDPMYAEDQYDQDGFPLQRASAGKKLGKKNKNKKESSLQSQQSVAGGSSTSTSTPFGGPRSHAPPQTLSNAALRMGHKMSRDQIWNTSTQAEKENIKQFWLELGEDERRSLVKVEKEAVLRKMKEQQKHSCSCTVCGRKRTAIEEELEVLYDAYYVELEQYANHGGSTVNDARILGKSRSLSHASGLDHAAHSHFASHGRIEDLDDEDLLDEDYDEDDEEDYSDDEDYDQQLPPGPQDFFTFGNSLTVRDGILTVADDLLKNDGKRFIDMMEQLAERRMQREEETRYPPTTLAHHNLHQGHNHPPMDEDDDYDEEEEDEDYDSQDDEDYEGDEMDSMTESQRMEEGRRMFQIFAARMFEQRVLTAYREKVARERQQKLLEELDEENRLDTQREAKKAREAAKKKEKKKAQKAAKDEEKAKREAEKTAQEEAARAAEQRKVEEQKQRKEEQRKKREAERKVQEEERARKEAEKQRKAAEERERQAEAERKQREAKERDKRKKEEARKREREDREAREREAKERKAREDRERKAKELARKEKEAATKAEREAKEQSRQPVGQASKRQVVAIPPGLHGNNPPPVLQSPHNVIATPILPKAPTPNRTRQTSQQGSQQGQHSHGSSPRSQQAATDNSTSSHSPASIVPPPSAANPQYKTQAQAPILHHPQPSAPLSPLNAPGRSHHLPYGGFTGGPGAGINGVPSSAPGMPPGMMQQMPMYPGPPMGGQHRNFGPPNGMPFPPGINGARPYHPNQAFHSQAPMPPPTSNPHPPTERNMRSQPHSRHPSGSTSFDQISQDIPPTPISRPGPIGPSNTTPDKSKPGHVRRLSKSPIVDELATQLGSKALLDDSDVPLSSNPSQPPTTAPGQPASGRIGFSPFSEHEGFHLPGPPHQPSNTTWGGAFGSSAPGMPNWGPPTSKPSGASGWPISAENHPTHPPHGPSNTFSAIGGMAPRPNAPRPVTIRLLIVQACRQLSMGAASPIDSASISPAGVGGFHSAAAVLRQVELIKPSQEPVPRMEEMLAICDTEGNAQNGGGSFTVNEEGGRGPFIRFDPDGPGGSGMIGPRAGAAGAPGDIGSPIVGHKEMSGFGGPIGGHRAL